MTRSSMKTETEFEPGNAMKSSRAARRLGRGLLLALVLGGAMLPAAQAAKDMPERRAVEIDARLSVGAGRAAFVETMAGGLFATGTDADTAWRTLKELLARLDIPIESEDAARHELVTGWVRWKVDPKTGKAMSKLELLQRAVATPLMEDHRFRFKVEADGTDARLAVADHAQLQEYRFTDDPDYTWIKWREAPPDPRAARTFLKHIQGAYEATLSTRIVEVPTASPAPVSLVVAPPPAAVPASPAPEPTPAPVHIVAVPPPVFSPVPAIVPAPTTAPTTQASPPPVPAPSVASPPFVQPAAPPSAPAAPASVPSAAPLAPTAPAPAVLPAQTPARTAERLGNALLVRASPEATWAALIEAARAMEITFTARDAENLAAVTDWIDYRYNARKQRFERNPDESQKLVYGFSGPQRQRHRFEFRLVPGKEAGTTLIHVVHLAWEAQDFRTPGGGDDLALVWRMQQPNRESILAFLRMFSTFLQVK